MKIDLIKHDYGRRFRRADRPAGHSERARIVAPSVLASLPRKVQGLASYLGSEVIPLVNALRPLQAADGAVVKEIREARRLVSDLRARGYDAYRMAYGADQVADAFAQDTALWLEDGLDRPPDFSHTVHAFPRTHLGQPVFALACVKTPNGPEPKGNFWETFLAIRDQPAELPEVQRQWPMDQNAPESARLLIGSHGFANGACVVFFHENVAASDFGTSSFAICFHNRYFGLFRGITLRRVHAMWPSSEWQCASAKAPDMYAVAGIRSHLHDYYHMQGPLPLSQHLQLKTTFVSGIVEELRVDLEAVLAGQASCSDWAEMLAEFVLLERMFRYPAQNDALRNFDAASGVLLYEYFRRCGVVSKQAPFALEHALNAAHHLLDELRTLEAAGPAQYRQATVEFVFSYLGLPQDGGRYSMPAGYLEDMAQCVATATDDWNGQLPL